MSKDKLKAKVEELKKKVKEVGELADEVVQLASVPDEDPGSGDPPD